MRATYATPAATAAFASVGPQANGSPIWNLTIEQWCVGRGTGGGSPTLARLLLLLGQSEPEVSNPFPLLPTPLPSSFLPSHRPPRSQDYLLYDQTRMVDASDDGSTLAFALYANQTFGADIVRRQTMGGERSRSRLGMMQWGREHQSAPLHHAPACLPPHRRSSRRSCTSSTRRRATCASSTTLARASSPGVRSRMGGEGKGREGEGIQPGAA